MDIDLMALEVVEKWEHEAAGKPYGQQKAMLQVIMIDLLKQQTLRAKIEGLAEIWESWTDVYVGGGEIAAALRKILEGEDETA